MESIEGVTTAQAINYWYNILDSELKDLVRARVLSLPSGNPPTLEFVFLATDSIAVNLAREKAAMPIVDYSKARRERKILCQNCSTSILKTRRTRRLQVQTASGEILFWLWICYSPSG